MKQLVLSLVLLARLAAAAVEVVVYSSKSDKPLHVSGGGVTRTFPASYTGHRAVCAMPGASTNDTFVAWTGDDAFAPGDPYGVSNLREFPEIELTRVSPVTPRISLLGGAADRLRTKNEIYQDVIDGINAETMTASQRSNALDQASWMDTNAIAEPYSRQDGGTRVRVVRWLVDGTPVWRIGVKPRVILDKKFRYRSGAALTEADILVDGAFDLDWQYFRSEVVNASGVERFELPVVEVDYLVVIGDGVTAWKGKDDTNNVIRALQQVVYRKYGTNHVQAVALPSGTQPLTHPAFRFRADCPEQSGYTSCQVQVMTGSVTNWTSGTVRIPPRDGSGTYVYSAPDLTGVVTTNAAYSWRVTVYNAKYRDDEWSDPESVMFSSGDVTNSTPRVDFSSRKAEVVVYSPRSDESLHVSGGGVTRTLPASYTGHRSTCAMPGASTNDTFVAWTGGESYTPGDLYGTSAGRGYQAIELTDMSPVTPRISLLGGTADRLRTKDEIYQDIIDRINAETMTASQRSNALDRTRWMDTNAIVEPYSRQDKDVRVRVVRWLVDDNPVWRCGVAPRVIFDQRFYSLEGETLTEADFITDDTFDLDWQYLQSEVVNTNGVKLFELPVVEVDYLVVIGDGVTAWKSSNDTNNVVRALQQVVYRKYGTNHVQAVALPSGTQPLTHPVFRFRADCPEDTGYTACQVQVLTGSVTNWTSGTVRIPPRDGSGTYVYSAPDLTDVVTTNATYSWRVTVYNAKYRDDEWSDPKPVTFE